MTHLDNDITEHVLCQQMITRIQWNKRAFLRHKRRTQRLGLDITRADVDRLANHLHHNQTQDRLLFQQILSLKKHFNKANNFLEETEFNMGTTAVDRNSDLDYNPDGDTSSSEGKFFFFFFLSTKNLTIAAMKMIYLRTVKVMVSI